MHWDVASHVFIPSRRLHAQITIRAKEDVFSTNGNIYETVAPSGMNYGTLKGSNCAWSDGLCIEH